MQLEKAQSGEAGLAGWISSNDVTLFTMVLVVIIALFLQRNLIRGASENERLTDRNVRLANTKKEVEESLAETQQRRDQLDAELKQRRQELQKTEEDLQAARADRDKLDGQLSTELERIAQLNRSLQRLDLEKNDLQQDKAQLTKNRDALTQEKATLTKNLAELSATLEAKVLALEDAEKQRDQLNEQSKTLDGIIATLQKKLDLAKSDLESQKQVSEKQLTEARKEVEKTAEKAAAETARADDYLARLRRAADLFKGMQTEKQTLEDRYERQRAREATLSRELVGLQGRLKRVAFLFDASGSMKKPGSTNDERWAEAQRIANTWLAHLDVDECVLVVFSSDVRTIPSDGTMFRVSGPDSETNRARLLESLSAVQPSGWTNTLDALRTAYTYEGLDTIILFSDGAPTNASTGRFDPAVVRQIYSLCRQHSEVPINTIGLGNYFDENMAAVLRNLASITGGTFRGR